MRWFDCHGMGSSARQSAPFALSWATLGSALVSAFVSVFVAVPVFVSVSKVAGAVLIASDDGEGNAVAPAEDPGWQHIGTRARNGMSVIYLGNGWVLTANHVGAEDVLLAGVVYRVVEGSSRRIVNENSSPTDLLLYRIAGQPALPALPRLRIAKTSPQVGDPVLMMGHGRNRGDSVRRQVEPGHWVKGWEWGSESTLRWGTNRISESGTDVNLRQSITRSIATLFEPPPDATRFEAQAARGDSGGAVFARARCGDAAAERRHADGSGGRTDACTSNTEWELAGVMFAVASNLHRKDDVSVFGSYTYAADLAHYRDQILSIVTAVRLVPTGAGETQE